MPNDTFVLRKSPGKEKYFVVSRRSGRKFSKKPLPKRRAEAQRRALYASQRRSLRGGDCGCGRSPSGGGNINYKRAALLGLTSAALSRNAGVGLGVGAASALFDRFD